LIEVGVLSADEMEAIRQQAQASIQAAAAAALAMPDPNPDQLEDEVYA
jgi:TPP-dependent pyruvate/acetoin dehydrogenase alpha subunit